MVNIQYQRSLKHFEVFYSLSGPCRAPEYGRWGFELCCGKAKHVLTRQGRKRCRSRRKPSGGRVCFFEILWGKTINSPCPEKDGWDSTSPSLPWRAKTLNFFNSRLRPKQFVQLVQFRFCASEIGAIIGVHFSRQSPSAGETLQCSNERLRGHVRNQFQVHGSGHHAHEYRYIRLLHNWFSPPLFYKNWASIIDVSHFEGMSRSHTARRQIPHLLACRCWSNTETSYATPSDFSYRRSPSY